MELVFLFAAIVSMMNGKRFSIVSISGLRTLMFAVLVAVGFTACSDNDDDPVVNPQLVEQIQGQWMAINDFWGEDDEAYFEAEDFEDADDIDPSIFDAHREVTYVEFEENGKGWFIFFAVDNDNEPVGNEKDGLQLSMNFEYAIQSDGSIKITSSTPIEETDDSEDFRFRYENGNLIADDGEMQFTLHRPSQAEDAQMTAWKIALGRFGASADNYNINDEDFTSTTWREQEAIYIYDGQGKDVTDAKGRTGYTLVNLPWYEGEKQTNLPNGFCDNITPENGWEWVLNRCGTRNIVNNNFFAVYNKYTGTLRIFYYMPNGFSTGNDHVWQVSLSDNLAHKSLWGFGLPSSENFKDKSKLAAIGEGTMVNYVTPWVEMRSDDGLIVPNAGWWAFDVDLSLYQPGVDVSNESIKLQMRSWNVQHVSLFSTLTATIEGSIKQTVKESNSTASDAAKGVMCGLGAAASIGSAIAFGKGTDKIGEMFGAIGNLFGCGSEFAGIFGGDDQPFEAEVSLGMNGTISTEGIIKGAVPTVGVASPTLRIKDFYTNGNHIGQGVWNITKHPKVYVIKDLKHDFYMIGNSALPETFVSFPYFFDPRSVEVELNPEVFPPGEIEWTNVVALCVASANTGINGTDRWRAGYGLKSRNLGTAPQTITTATTEGVDLGPMMIQPGVKEFYDYMDYHRTDEDKKNVFYPIQVCQTGDYTNRNREVIYGRGVSFNYAIEPAFLKEIEPTAWMTKADIPIKMPDLMVNVIVTVKLKGKAEPICFSRNYLPEFETITRSQLKSIADDCWNEYSDSYQRNTEYFSQLYRIKYLYEVIKWY